MATANRENLLNTYRVIVADYILPPEQLGEPLIGTYIDNAINRVSIKHPISPVNTYYNTSMRQDILDDVTEQTNDATIEQLLNTYSVIIMGILSYNQRRTPNLDQVIKNAINEVSIKMGDVNITDIISNSGVGPSIGIRIKEIIDEAAKASLVDKASAAGGGRSSKKSKKRSTLRRRSSVHKTRKINRLHKY